MRTEREKKTLGSWRLWQVESAWFPGLARKPDLQVLALCFSLVGLVTHDKHKAIVD